MGLDEKSANDIVGYADHTLGLPILSRSIRIGQTENDTVLVKERVRKIVIKFSAIITLHGLKRSVELGLYVSMKFF